MKTKAILHSLESLESRIAPAAITIMYTDLDGDLVKITASKTGAVAPPLDATDLTFVGGGTSGQLARLNLTDAGFDAASILFTVTKKPGGDGLAHVGFIDATDRDLDKVIVKGDLGRIIAGDAITSSDPGLKLLQARTIGTLGLVTQDGVGDLESRITGKLGALKVAGDVTDAYIRATALVDSDGQLGSVFIGGDLSGGTDTSSGSVTSTGSMGAVFIGGDLTGGAGVGSGRVFSFGVMGDVRVGGRFAGGAGDLSGQIRSFGPMGDVLIAGDMVGGGADSSGVIVSTSSIGDVRIGGNLIGGSITGAASLNDSGEIRSVGRIASVTIVGSLIAGIDASTGTLDRCGAIVAEDDLGPVKIGRSVLGNSTNAALIIAQGQAVKPGTGFDTAIASVTVGGDVRFARILAGFDQFEGSANADASIGAVTVGRDWVASSLVAGAQDTGAPGFGIGDTLQGVGNTPLIARIVSITIKGDVNGSLAVGDHFGFVAQQIGKLKIGPMSFALAAGPSNDSLPIPFTSDVRLLEVS